MPEGAVQTEPAGAVAVRQCRKMDNSGMGTTTLTSVESYLSAVYDPDVDYVDGALEDRNVGEKDHAKLQLKVARLLDSLGGYFVTIETRIRISDARYRVPDICVYDREPDEQVFTAPPLLIVEILSPEDRMSRMQEKMEDYCRMGCHDIWILDPARRKAYRYETPATIEVFDGLTVGRDSRLSLSLPQIFG